MPALASSCSRVPQGQNILALRRTRALLLALRHPGRYRSSFVAPGDMPGNGVAGHEARIAGTAQGAPSRRRARASLLASEPPHQSETKRAKVVGSLAVPNAPAGARFAVPGGVITNPFGMMP